MGTSWALIAAAIGAAPRGSALLAGASAAAVILIAVTAAIGLARERRRT